MIKLKIHINYSPIFEICQKRAYFRLILLDFFVILSDMSTEDCSSDFYLGIVKFH